MAVTRIRTVWKGIGFQFAALFAYCFWFLRAGRQKAVTVILSLLAVTVSGILNSYL